MNRKIRDISETAHSRTLLKWWKFVYFKERKTYKKWVHKGVVRFHLTRFSCTFYFISRFENHQAKWTAKSGIFPRQLIVGPPETCEKLLISKKGKRIENKKTSDNYVELGPFDHVLENEWDFAPFQRAGVELRGGLPRGVHYELSRKYPPRWRADRFT